MSINVPTTTTPAGWYPDSQDPSRQRYWDGTAWTDNYGPAVPGVPSPPVVPPKKKRHIGRWVFGGIGLLVLIMIISAVTSGGGGGTKSGTGTTGGTTAVAGIGDPVRDGQFEFTAKSMKCGVKAVGGQFGETAQGQYCLVTMNVKNIGNQSQMFDASSQIAYDAAGNQISADSMASIDANQGTQTFLQDINPGNQVTGVIVYDIPKNQNLTKLELHDSPFSNGVSVTL